MTPSVLVVEDEPAIQELLRVNLVDAGYEVRAAPDAESAQRELADALPSLLLLDWMLPGKSGLALAKELRGDTRTRELPIIMLTARTDEADKVAGFAVGADDYLTKPFSLRELAARVRAILRRMDRIQRSTPQEPALRFDLTIDPARRRVTKDGEEIVLTPLEFEILLTLARSPGVVMSRDQLMDRVWGYRDYAGGRVVDSHVARIRRKLGDEAGEPKYIRTVHGVGYAFREDGPG